jgi:hypothetical protein
MMSVILDGRGLHLFVLGGVVVATTRHGSALDRRGTRAPGPEVIA